MALTKGIPYRERVHLISGGARKAHDVVVIPLEGASVGAAIDVAALETAQGELVRHVAAYERTLDRVATGVAIFGPDQRLTFFNEAYRALWQLDADWLATKPTDGELLDRLRELSRLPEVVNYRDWKAKILAGYKTGTEYEDWWHLLDGRTIHVVSAQRPDGGLTYLYDDATERFALESRYNALIDVQRETLDSLKEGVAVFATDGRLKLFNSAVLQIWRLPRSTLKEGPHIDKIIAQCSSLYDDMATWARISRAVTGISDRRQPVAGQMLRPDQSVIDFAVAPLPDGATLITFVDVTDSKRYEQTLIERNEALVAADRLKSQFISHVSYELRTPLTNIIGFSELLSSPRTGELNSKQREYLNDISASSRTLLAIINDILDLATIDAGALELKLAPVKVDRRRRHGRARRARPRQPRAPQSRHPHCRGCGGVHRRRGAGSAGAVQSARQCHRLLQAGRHHQRDRPARGRHDGIHRRGQGRRHPQGPAAAHARAFREPQPGLQAPRRRPRAGDRQEPGGAARRRHVARVRARPGHQRDRALPRERRAPRAGTRGRPCMTAEWTRDLDEAGVVRLADLLALKIGRGDVIALRGEVGAGKTTLARALIAALLGDCCGRGAEPDLLAEPGLRDAAADGHALRLLSPRLRRRGARGGLRRGD